jgi:subtilisin family serine protease
MSDNPRRPILYRGELYSSFVEKKTGGGSKEPLVKYEDARAKIISDIANVKEAIRTIPNEKRLPNEFVVCLRMPEEFSAKSYYPDTIFDTNISKFGLKEIGSRRWTEESSRSVNTGGKLFFVRATEKSLESLRERLDKSEDFLTKQFKTDISKISSLDILRPTEQILGIDDNWQSGRLEAVLHPFYLDKQLSLSQFITLIEKSGLNKNNVKVKQYGEGVSFLSFIGNREMLTSISGYNPLRTVHPLLMRNLPSLSRGQIINGGPQIPDFKKKSSIVVGVIDGGTERNNPYLQNYVVSEDAVSEPEHSEYVSHGTQVCGTVLYGPLNDFNANAKLPEPFVSVKSFRVLSSNTIDPDLYDVIDAIEKIIPANRDISVYNLSLGPKGPILDDSISRFTFSCDLLSKQFEILFCVAVGNDGEITGYDRIQSPSDSVNSLAVGAYTKRNGNLQKAPYSCIGPGREGNKLKPDLLAFGGCDQTPIHLIGSSVGQKVWNMGTSFASPIVAGAVGLIIGGSNKAINSLTGRALIVHSVSEKNGIGHSLNLGHGILPESMNDVITCKDKSYTLIYQGEIEPGKFAEFQIPWVNEIIQGRAILRWTVSVLTDVDAQSPDDYTSSSVETVFYPHSNKYRFEKNGKTATVDIASETAKVALLLSTGWKQSNFPISASGNPHKTEEDLRLDLKWDSMDTREVSKRAISLNNPKFHLHAMGRGSRVNQSKVRFSLVLSLEAPAATVDLYSKVLAKYNALVPLTLSVDVSVPVTV